MIIWGNIKLELVQTQDEIKLFSELHYITRIRNHI